MSMLWDYGTDTAHVQLKPRVPGTFPQLDAPLHASSDVAVTMKTPIARSLVKIAMALKPLDCMNEETRAT